ncbi:MraY family glycosyltransferase [Burkholderia ubonensis]|uniref:MraY family glycosyltransferase n=1 Tax=Burkholderia ubonensis TaxID=101571 RepID=UPI0008FE07EC|nr:glycosyltransferase family 4 protein [Burkholderia ubonensis]OJA26991.1 glycosyl transferase [Burkholderia ubonensis]
MLIWGLGAACGAAAVLWSLLKTGLAWKLATDIPNCRSLHTLPTPRVGGWGVIPAAVAGIWLASPGLAVMAALAAALAVMSQVDDRRGLPARVRFAAHVISVIVLLIAYPADFPLWVVVIAAFVLVWLINLYNFMDGADGLAGGMALFGFGGYALAALAVPNHVPGIGLAAAAIAGASAGFLCFNFHPARLFLGDAGSIALGFLAGGLGYYGWIRHIWPLWFPAVIFSPFIADATVTLLRRLLRGEKFWQAHREHYYQRMIRAGFGHTRTALCWYALMAFGVAVALAALRTSVLVQWVIAVGWYSVLAGIGVVVDAKWRQFQQREFGQTEV